MFLAKKLLIGPYVAIVIFVVCNLLLKYLHVESVDKQVNIFFHYQSCREICLYMMNLYSAKLFLINWSKTKIQTTVDPCPPSTFR